MMEACRRLLIVALLGGAACTSAPPPEPAPTPAPARAPAPVEKPAPAAAPPEKPAEKKVLPPAPAPVPVRAAPKRRVASPRGLGVARPARLSARNDTIPARTLRAPVRVCAGGDVTLGTNLEREWSRIASRRMRTRFHLEDDPASLLEPLRPLVKDADVVLLNVESAIGDGAAPSKCGPASTHCFAFRSPASAAPALRSLTSRAIVANIANNHARDAGEAGQDSTVAALTRAGVLVTGDDSIATAVPTPSGDTIGVLGFYTSTDTPDARDTAEVRRLVARAAERFPVVIATMHLGAEGRNAQHTMDQGETYLNIDRGNPVAFADAAVRGGAAMVIGHGPHVLRGVEWRQHGALIAYSLGNLLTYGPFILKEPLNRGAVLCATVDTRGRVSEASLVSTVQRAPGVLARDPAREAGSLVDSLGRLDFPASGARVEGSGTLRPRAR